MTTAAVLLLAAVVAAAALVWSIERKRHFHIWLPAYWRQRSQRRAAFRQPTHVLFCFVDHFEPWNWDRTTEESLRLMRGWVERYPTMARRHADSRGVAPQHTWFYPGEGYQAEFLELTQQLVAGGYGEIELHLHHSYDSETSLREKLRQAKALFTRHGLLQPPGAVGPQFAFIHGNLGLCNGLGPEYCGVNDELRILREEGCYADLSAPTYPAASQTRKINCVYYARSSRNVPKMHDQGADVSVGGQADGDLMLIQGPLGLDWTRRKLGFLPSVDNAEVSAHIPGTRRRARLWAGQRVCVSGREDWVIIKVHCHGGQAEDADALLGDGADAMFSALEAEFRDREGFFLHYVTARELYNIIKAAEAGRTGDPHDYRDFVVAPPVAGRRSGLRAAPAAASMSADAAPAQAR